MKRYIKSMGAVVPAEDVERHLKYNPTVDKDSFKKLVRYAKDNNNSRLLKDLKTLIEADIAADSLKFPEYSNEIQKYYSDKFLRSI